MGELSSYLGTAHIPGVFPAWFDRAFRSGENNARIEIASMSDGFIEGTFSVENVAKSNGQEGGELIFIEPSRFKVANERYAIEVGTVIELKA